MKKVLVISGVVLWSSLGFGEWWITSVDTGGGACSIALDSCGYPHIAYDQYVKAAPIKYASWNIDSTWTIELVDSSLSPIPKLAFDSKNRPHIVWSRHYAYKDSLGWHVESPPYPLFVGYHRSLAIDKNDYPHAVFIDVAGDTFLCHCYRVSGAWYCDTLDYNADYQQVSITIGDSNTIHIAYITSLE